MAARIDTPDDEIVSEINITPLTDIFLVLLIIFMISSTAMMESGLSVKLPSSQSQASGQATQQKPIYVTMSKDGQIRLNETAVSEQDLEGALKKLLAATNEKTVILRGDESIVLGKAVKIMDIAKSLGADKIAIATSPGEKKR